MGIFGWSYPPGCDSVPGDEDAGVILDDRRTLKGYGKPGHGLCGKDADLSEEGQIVVESAVWTDDSLVTCDIECYATLCPGEEWTEKQRDAAQETVWGSGQSGEWDGDAWVMTYHCRIRYESEFENEDDVIAELCKKIFGDAGVQAFRREMKGCNDMFNAIDKEEEQAD